MVVFTPAPHLPTSGKRARYLLPSNQLFVYYFRIVTPRSIHTPPPTPPNHRIDNNYGHSDNNDTVQHSCTLLCRTIPKINASEGYRQETKTYFNRYQRTRFLKTRLRIRVRQSCATIWVAFRLAARNLLKRFINKAPQGMNVCTYRVHVIPS